MVLPKSKNAVGLGNSLMNDRFGKGKGADMRRGNAQGGVVRKDQFGDNYVTPDKKAAACEKMRSVTEQGALDEFLSTAELAGTDFTAEKLNNVKIIHTDQKNPYLLSAAEERVQVKKQQKNKERLTVPRRPQWDKNTTREELDTRERQSLLMWRRGLAELQENNDLLLTPFERNLEVWRQLWRVIERSDLVVQIVDARNPLLYRCDDLERYVKEVDKKKRNLLLVNKADMLTHEQRTEWAKYFLDNGIRFKFFSAELAKEINEAKGLGLQDDDEDDLTSEEDDEEEEEESEEDPVQKEMEKTLDGDENALAKEARKLDIQDEEDENAKWVDEETIDDDEDDDEEDDVVNATLEESTRIITTDELEALFLQHSPKQAANADASQPERKTQIGLVGYPNVGKSSSINALLGAKKVSVSSTPGKTKHFQTIHLSPRVILCDCPGLVFPNFASTKAELVVNGVLPIDQMREHTGPATLVASRIPLSFLEAVYGVQIHMRPLEEGGTGIPTGSELLRAYAQARGFMTSGLGQPDESRASRFVLKDYVKGKLLFCHPPPSDPPIDTKVFNRDLYDAAHLPQKRRAALAVQNVPETDPSLMDEEPDMIPLPAPGAKTAHLDKKFFGPGQGVGNMTTPFHHKYSEQGQAAETARIEGLAEGERRPLTGRKARTMLALERDIDPEDVKNAMGKGGKKHFKANKRAAKKVRSEYD